MAVTITPYGKTADGLEVWQVVLENGPYELRALTYGATITHLFVPGRDGQKLDVLLGYSRLQDYEKGTAYLGALVGRNANRIADASITIDGTVWPLIANEGTKQLHGGPGGFARRVFEAKPEGDSAVRFILDSADGDQGYPGAVHLEAVYSLSADGAVTLDYTATTTKPTLVNITNHSYFNLAGHDKTDAAMNQLLTLPGRFFNPDDAESIPTGELRDVAGTPMDFRTPKAIGQDIGADYEPLHLQGGYDHNWEVFCNPCAILSDPVSGRSLAISTDCPGIQFYAGNFLDEQGKDGVYYCKRSGVALETQFYPDALHHPQWPQPITKAGETYRSVTTYQFSW